MAAFKLMSESRNLTLLQAMFSSIAKIFGDETGKLNPMLIPWILTSSKSADNLEMPYLDAILNGSCSSPEARETYSYDWKRWNKIYSIDDIDAQQGPNPCRVDPPHECCGVMASIANMNPTLTILSMSYAHAQKKQNHAALADYLGLDPNDKYPVRKHEVIPVCRLPGGELTWFCNPALTRVMFSSMGVCSSYNAPNLKTIYKKSPTMDKYDQIFNYRIDDDVDTFKPITGLGAGKLAAV